MTQQKSTYETNAMEMSELVYQHRLKLGDVDYERMLFLLKDRNEQEKIEQSLNNGNLKNNWLVRDKIMCILAELNHIVDMKTRSSGSVLQRFIKCMFVELEEWSKFDKKFFYENPRTRGNQSALTADEYYREKIWKIYSILFTNHVHGCQQMCSECGRFECSDDADCVYGSGCLPSMLSYMQNKKIVDLINHFKFD